MFTYSAVVLTVEKSIVFLNYKFYKPGVFVRDKNFTLFTGYPDK